jgi:hypothetical protein
MIANSRNIAVIEFKARAMIYLSADQYTNLLKNCPNLIMKRRTLIKGLATGIIFLIPI